MVWPENSSDIDPYADPSARADDRRTPRRRSACPLLMGAVVGDRVDDGWYNRAIVWSPDGQPGRFYDKTHPVPFGEYIPLRSAARAAGPRPATRSPATWSRGTAPGRAAGRAGDGRRC